MNGERYTPQTREQAIESLKREMLAACRRRAEEREAKR